MDKPAGLSPSLYDKDYYLKSLPGRAYLERMDVLDPAINDTVCLGEIQPGDRVLDFGCGRGALVIALAKRGCRVTGVDFSQDAIRFANEFLKQFPNEIKTRVEFRQMDMSGLNFEREFDAIVFNQVYEHLRDWELDSLLSKFGRALKTSGTLVISTPNLNYIRFLFPLKRIANFPFKVAKEILRLIHGRSKHAGSVGTFLKEIFKIRYPESEHTRLHVNLQTPTSIRRFVEAHGFQTVVVCVDPHKDLLTFLARKWWGETIWVSAQPA